MQEMGMLEQLPENQTCPLTSPVLPREVENVLRKLEKSDVWMKWNGRRREHRRRMFYLVSGIGEFEQQWGYALKRLGY